jgi:hypothetical protein
MAVRKSLFVVMALSLVLASSSFANDSPMPPVENAPVAKSKKSLPPTEAPTPKVESAAATSPPATPLSRQRRQRRQQWERVLQAPAELAVDGQKSITLGALLDQIRKKHGLNVQIDMPHLLPMAAALNPDNQKSSHAPTARMGGLFPFVVRSSSLGMSAPVYASSPAATGPVPGYSNPPMIVSGSPVYSAQAPVCSAPACAAPVAVGPITSAPRVVSSLAAAPAYAAPVAAAPAAAAHAAAPPFVVNGELRNASPPVSVAQAAPSGEVSASDEEDLPPVRVTSDEPVESIPPTKVVPSQKAAVLEYLSEDDETEDEAPAKPGKKKTGADEKRKIKAALKAANDSRKNDDSKPKDEAKEDDEDGSRKIKAALKEADDKEKESSSTPEDDDKGKVEASESKPETSHAITDAMQEILEIPIDVAVISQPNGTVEDVLRQAFERALPFQATMNAALFEEEMPMLASLTQATEWDLLVQDNGVLVTSRLNANLQKETRVYSTRALEQASKLKTEEVARVITRTVRPWSWKQYFPDANAEVKSTVPTKSKSNAATKFTVPKASLELLGLLLSSRSPVQRHIRLTSDEESSSESSAVSSSSEKVELTEEDLALMGRMWDGLFQGAVTSIQVLYHGDPPTGVVEVLPGMLIISQSQGAHREIADLLEQLAHPEN